MNSFSCQWEEIQLKRHDHRLFRVKINTKSRPVCKYYKRQQHLIAVTINTNINNNHNDSNNRLIQNSQVYRKSYDSGEQEDAATSSEEFDFSSDE